MLCSQTNITSIGAKAAVRFITVTMTVMYDRPREPLGRLVWGKHLHLCEQMFIRLGALPSRSMSIQNGIGAYFPTDH